MNHQQNAFSLFSFGITTDLESLKNHHYKIYFNRFACNFQIQKRLSHNRQTIDSAISSYQPYQAKRRFRTERVPCNFNAKRTVVLKP